MTSSSRRFLRLEQLTGLLKSRSHWRTWELSEELGVSPRTLARDLDLLREQGLPIEGDRGVGGGIRLHRNYGIGRVSLSQGETLDLLLALAVMEQLDSALMLSHLRSVRHKLAIGFSERQRQKLEGLRERILVGGPASLDVLGNYTRPDPELMPVLQAAFFERRKAEITYRNERAETNQRVVELHYLFLNCPVWYLLCWDQLREAVRQFRVDRVLEARLLEPGFGWREPELFLAEVRAFGINV